ncbi:DUF2891 family protein [Phaeobacter sp. JH204B]
MPVNPVNPVRGTVNADTIMGTAGADTLVGLGGDDSLIGDAGNDSLVGGSGNDTLRGGHGDDTLIGGDGDDEIEGLYGNDVIDTGAGNDHVFGRDGDDLIFGRSGDDHLIGSIGTDTVYGGDGNDVLAGSQGNDEIHGGNGNDIAFIGTFEDSDRIFMDAGDDIVDGALAGSSFYAEGGSGSDTMTAGVGNDTLLGGSGDDLLSGGSGNDLLSGGGDSDTISGGDGDDIFLIQDVPGRLLITDFGANGAADMIDLSELTGYGSAEAVSSGMTFGPYQTTLNLNVTGGELVITIQHETPLTAADLGLSGALTGTDTGEGPTEFGGGDTGSGGTGPDTPPPDVDTGTGTGGTGGTGVTYTLAGQDAAIFVVDPDTGDVSYQDWFTPNYEEVWDLDRDHIYEISVIGTDANGAEVSQQNLELVVSETGATWQDATGDIPNPGNGGSDQQDPGAGVWEGENAAGVTYTLTGHDAAIFLVDPDSGDVSYQSWFTPNYEEVWDLDRDHIYEISVIGTDPNGAEVSQQDLELVVSETGAIWQEVGGDTSDPDDGVTDPGDPVLETDYLNGDADDELLTTFDALADRYLDARGHATAPIFNGSVDWHSSVHAHLANVAAYEATGDQAGLQAFADDRFSAEDVQGEIDLTHNDPYGWAWLLKLDTKLQDNGIDNLAPAGDHFAAELEARLSQRIEAGTSDAGTGSYGDANWQIANLIQYAQHQNDAPAEARYMQMFEQIQSDTNVSGETEIDEGDFFSSLSLSAYAHVIAGETDTALFDDIHAQMLQSVTDGSLEDLLDTEGARLDAGVGFSHSAGIAISSAYGYWAMFAETENPAFYHAYSNVVEWTETYAAEMGANIGPGHWLPNFASFAADLPTQLPVADPDGSLTTQIDDWVPGAGGDGADILIGGNDNDLLSGGAGDDLLDGQGGKDTLDGGTGDDTLRAGFDDGTGDVFIGGAGRDTYDIANSDVSVYGFNIDLRDGTDQYGNTYSGIENILGSDTNDRLLGNGSRNYLHGGNGNDTLSGRYGADVLDGGNGKDILRGGHGNDTLRAGFDDGTGDVFDGGAGSDTYDIANSDVRGYGFNIDLNTGTDQYHNSYTRIENILGGTADDTLRGDDADNYLNGGDGDDILNGRAGDDVLTGGAGNDVFAVTADTGSVQITDFGQNGDADQIDVSALTSFFADPQALMAALSHSDGQTSFNIELDEGTRLVTIQSDQELEEEDFIF